MRDEPPWLLLVWLVVCVVVASELGVDAEDWNEVKSEEDEACDVKATLLLPNWLVGSVVVANELSMDVEDENEGKSEVDETCNLKAVLL